MTLGAMSHASSGGLRTVGRADQGIQVVAEAPGANQGASQWRLAQFTERAISPTPARAATSALLLPCVTHAGVDTAATIAGRWRYRWMAAHSLPPSRR